MPLKSAAAAANASGDAIKYDIMVLPPEIDSLQDYGRACANWQLGTFVVTPGAIGPDRKRRWVTPRYSVGPMNTNRYFPIWISSWLLSTAESTG